MNDLSSREDVNAVVKDFYYHVSCDDLLGPIFNTVAEVDWHHHIDLLTNYWCRVLLGENSYRGKILLTHQDLHSLHALTKPAFDRWYELWCTTINDAHDGPTAEKAKSHARKIAKLLSRRLAQTDWTPPAITQPALAT